jgi:hypothetical protein
MNEEEKSLFTTYQYLLHANHTYPFQPYFNLSSNHDVDLVLKPILSRGLKHSISTKDVSNEEIDNALTKFTNSGLWQIFFSSNPPDDNFDNKLYKAMKPYLPPTKPCSPLIELEHPMVESFKDLSLDIKKHLMNHPVNPNSGSEFKKIKKIKDQFPLVKFIASDKNLGLVALDLSYYDRMVMFHLSNQDNYTLLDPQDDELLPSTWNIK